MGTLQIKNLPEPVHAELRRRAAQAHQSVRDYVLTLIERDQRSPTMSDWLDRLAQDAPVETTTTAAEAVQAGRDEREAERAAGTADRR
ncbi:MAG: FitA-like ribbon-helix-helix domain-containing protein [Solirubrobacteraceae bacterium]